MRADKLKLLMTVFYACTICFACINLWANWHLLNSGYRFLEEGFTPEWLPFLTRTMMNFRVLWAVSGLCLPLVASAAFFGWPPARSFPVIFGLMMAAMAQTVVTLVAMIAPILKLPY